MKGYKAFEYDMTCRGFQYAIGETYKHEGEIMPCKSGFHFCKSIADCYRFYSMNDAVIICEVEALGEIKTDDDIKFCTDEIKIISKVNDPRAASNTSESNSGYCNSGNHNNGSWNSGDYNRGHWDSGDYNSGNCNSGHHNSGDVNSGDYNNGDCNSGNHNDGDRNSGNWNSGDRNSGDHNSGHHNSGDFNSGCWNNGHQNCGSHNSGNRNRGDRNSGHYNSGYYNSGDCNSGNWNSGYWNKGNRHSGVFNVDPEPKIRMFDNESEWTMQDWYDSKACAIMSNCPCTYSDYEDKQKWWDSLSDEDKNEVKSLPNFDADKFYLCTEIRV